MAVAVRIEIFLPTKQITQGKAACDSWITRERRDREIETCRFLEREEEERDKDA